MSTTTSKNTIDKDAIKWYVARCHSRAHNKVRSLLMAEGMEFYVPETIEVIVEKGKKTKRTVPLFKDIFFIHDSFNRINDRIKRGALPIAFYFSHTSHIKDDALWVSDREMLSFMIASKCTDKNPTIHPFGEINLRNGDQIRVVEGPLQGAEGYFVQIKRGQRKQLVLTLANLMTLNLTVGEEDLIEIIAKNKDAQRQENAAQTQKEDNQTQKKVTQTQKEGNQTQEGQQQAQTV